MDIDIEKLAKTVAESLNLKDFKGDVVALKVVENEIGNIASGGIGVQKVYRRDDTNTEGKGHANNSPRGNAGNSEKDEECFHFIHPEVGEEESWIIHEGIKRLVTHQKVKEICKYLKDLKKSGKVLLPERPSNMYNELVRLGMPTGDGFSEKYFSSCYTK